MGGRGGSSGLSGGGITVGETITVDGYKIREGNVTSPSGASRYVSSYEELSQSTKQKMKSALDKAGIKDPVAAGKMILPRSVADASIKQIKAEKAALQKNVPGLKELRAAMDYDSNQKEKFRKSVNSGSGVIEGNPNSNTSKSVRNKYPRAAAYVTAQSYYDSSNSYKSALGKEAMNKIASGKSATAAINEMKKKWKKHTESKMRD